MITEYLERPRAYELEQEARAAAREQRIVDAYEVAHNEAMAGRGEFWNDCHQSIYDAVREAMQCALTPELFKATVWLAVCEEAEKYAHAVAEDTD